MSEKIEHTPGPWNLCVHLEDHDKCPCGYRGGIWSGDGELLVCEMGASPEHDGTQLMPQSDRPVQFADARLIAAAPDLLAALKALNEIIEAAKWGARWPGRPHAQCDAARAAIARAEGHTHST